MFEESADFNVIRAAATAAPNFGLTTEAILGHLARWKSCCAFRVTAAAHDTIDIEFDTLPADMDAFVKNLYAFCPDLVDQGTGCVDEMRDALDESGSERPAEMESLLDGIDFKDENYGLEILKRELQRNRKIQLWWD